MTQYSPFVGPGSCLYIAILESSAAARSKTKGAHSKSLRDQMSGCCKRVTLCRRHNLVMFMMLDAVFLSTMESICS